MVRVTQLFSIRGGARTAPGNQVSTIGRGARTQAVAYLACAFAGPARAAQSLETWFPRPPPVAARAVMHPARLSGAWARVTPGN